MKDWYHESCLNLRERPGSRAPTPFLQPGHSGVRSDGDPEPNDAEDDGSEASSSDLPPPLIGDASYESLICRRCVLGNNTLKRCAGTRGVLMVVRDDATS